MIAPVVQHPVSDQTTYKQTPTYMHANKKSLQVSIGLGVYECLSLHERSRSRLRHDGCETVRGLRPLTKLTIDIQRGIST
jgi:hypothetical protein